MNNYDWLNLIPEGWVELAREMIQKVKTIYPEFEITDLKEKYGRLVCYDTGVPAEANDIIVEYEILSARTCCICGKPATKISTGWICPYCDDCGDKDEKFYKRFK